MLYIPDWSFLEENMLHNGKYTVHVNGKACTVCACRVSAMPFNRVWPGHQRPAEQSEQAAFVSFFGDEAVEVEVTYTGVLTEPTVRPTAKGVTVERTAAGCRFWLRENGSYVFGPDGDRAVLHIFFSKPPVHPEKETATYYFGPGVHTPLLLQLKDNDSVYVDPEAVVFTAIYADGVQNVRIYGGGILNNSCQERTLRPCHARFPSGNIRLWNARGVRVEDVILVDSSNFVLSCYESRDIVIDGVKIVGQWRYNTDGIDLVNSSDALVRNCFVRSFDDGICVKAIYDHDVCENITVENCTVWCDWGKALELGLETAAGEYRNITYRGCDLIHNSTGAMAISNGHYADIHHISYEDIRVEFRKADRPQVLEGPEHPVYEWDGTPYMENLIKLTNWPMSSVGIYKKSNYSKRAQHGHTHDITYRDIRVLTDYDIGRPNLLLWSESAQAPLENIVIEHVFLNGEEIASPEGFAVTAGHAQNVYYNGQNFFPET